MASHKKVRGKMAEERKDKYEIPEIEGADREDVTRISDDVLVTIVGKALTEIEGVVAVPGGIVSGILGRKGPGKGIKVEASDEEVVIEVAVVVGYGIRIPDVAATIQSKIRGAVEEMTGKYVRAVNVTVQGIRLPGAVQPPVLEEVVAEEEVEAFSEKKKKEKEQ
jgi:uncharacterized alkaline shock family protein YloU